MTGRTTATVSGTRTAGRSAWRFPLLLSAALAVSMAYGVTLPLLPAVLGIIPGLTVDDVARHAGWLTATYTVGLFFFSPMWGALADRADRRGIIAFGLAGSGLALWTVDLSRDLVSLYLARGAAGVLAAAVLPAVFACVVDDAEPRQRQRRFAWVATATSVGFLLGPVVGSALRSMAMGLGASRPMADSPFAAVALLSIAAAACMYIVPACRGKRAADGEGTADESSVRIALLQTGVVVLAITVAEVGLTLVSRDAPAIAASGLAGYFALCSVTMVVVQLWLYPALERGLGEPRLVRMAFAAMALGVGLLAWPQARWVPVAVFLLAGASVGVLIPALAARVSRAAGARQGWALGRQAAAANLGQALGAAATSVLYAAAAPVPFVLAAVSVRGTPAAALAGTLGACPAPMEFLAVNFGTSMRLRAAGAGVARTLGLEHAEIERSLYEQSGMAALGGHGGDLLLIEAAAAGGGDAGVAELLAPGSPARILLVEAREEWAMVREALRLLRPT